MTRTDVPRWTSIVAVLAGLWAVVAPFAWSAGETLLWSNVAAGAVVALAAAYNTYRVHVGDIVNGWAAGLVVVAGVWLAASPYVLGGAATALLWSDVIAGLLAAVLAGYSLYTAPEAEGWSPGRPTA